MKKKKKSESGSSNEKPTRTEALIDDFTSSLTDSVNLDSKIADTILGLEALRRPSKATALVKGPVKFIDADLADLLEIDLKSLALESQAVAGPFDFGKIKEWAESGKMNKAIQVQIAYGRWKGLKEHFPDLSSTKLGGDEVTDTSSTTEYTSTQTLTEEMSNIELESLEDVAANALLKNKISPTLQKNTPLAASATSAPLKLEVEVDIPQNLNTATVAKVPAARTSPVTHDSGPGMREWATRKLWWVAGALAFVVAFLVIQKKTQRSQVEKNYLNTKMHSEYVDQKKQDYPEGLRPLSVEALYQSFDQLNLVPLKKIALKYDFSNSEISESEVVTLRNFADPASASLAGQKISSNMLASVYMDFGKVEEAVKILSAWVANGDTDPNTFINLALAHFLMGDYSLAREIGGSGLRLCSSGNCWIASSILGMAEVAKGHFEEGQRHFQNAINRSSQNPLPYGLWLYVLLKFPQAFKIRSPTILRDALWADPDRWLDAPLRAPLAGRVLTRLSLEGLSEAARESNSLSSQSHLRSYLIEMTTGLKQGIDWTDSYDPSLLLQNEDYKSQVLAAYVLASKGRLTEASDVIGRVTMLLTSDQVTGSWPWSLAGDIQFQRGQLDLATIAYQNALSRSQINSPAVLGMALAFREKSSFSPAIQKFTEAEGQDPLFIPATLRMSRSEWKKVRKGLSF